MEVWEFLKELTNPESIIKYGGLALLTFVVFAETGLFIGFFLPGDSLLFTAGLLCGIGILESSIQTVIFSICVAAILGNMTGYWFGFKVGPSLFKKKDSILFKKKYVEMTDTFYQRHGGKALILGRFLPIIRTFAPILAGVIKMNFRIFMFYNIIGSLLWGISLTLIGYFLGIKFPWIKDYLGYIVIFLIIITAIPVINTIRKERKSVDS